MCFRVSVIQQHASSRSNPKNHQCSVVIDKEKENLSQKASSLFLPSPRSADLEKCHGCVWTNPVQPRPAASRAIHTLHSPYAGLQHAILQWVQPNTCSSINSCIIFNYLNLNYLINSPNPMGPYFGKNMYCSEWLRLSIGKGSTYVWWVLACVQGCWGRVHTFKK